MSQPPLHKVVDTLSERMLGWRNNIDYNCANLNGKFLDQIMGEAVATMKSQRDHIEDLELALERAKEGKSK